MQTDKAKIDECDTPQLLPFRVPVGHFIRFAYSHHHTSFILSTTMGNKISNVTAIAGIDSYVSELGDIYYERRYKEWETHSIWWDDMGSFLLAILSIGNARFMKTIRGRHKDTLVVVKIFVKPDPQLSLRSYVKKLQGMWFKNKVGYDWISSWLRFLRRAWCPYQRFERISFSTYPGNRQGSVPRSSILLQQSLRSHKVNPPLWSLTFAIHKIDAIHRCIVHARSWRWLKRNGSHIKFSRQ